MARPLLPGKAMNGDTVIVGAGLAGLSAARELETAGEKPVVLEKSRGLGGRCATRRIGGQPVDHGLTFLHGSDPSLQRVIEGIGGARRLPGWPQKIEGEGTPCQPRAFSTGQWRVAFAEGLSAFPKHLARGLDVRLETRVGAVALEKGRLRVGIASGARMDARRLLLALPTEQTLELLSGLPQELPELRAAARLLRMVRSLPSLTLIAGYGRDAVTPSWDLFLPDPAPVVSLVSHDSAKRGGEIERILVYQCAPRWSRAHLEDPPGEVEAAILDEAARLIGPWAGRPEWTQGHRWRYARVDGGSELSGPIVIPLPGGATIGLAGELFAPGGGVEAAWTSGVRLARRLVGKEDE